MLKNWKVKVLFQFLLSLCPSGEQINYFFQVLNKRHKPESIAQKVRTYVQRINLINKYKQLDGCTIVEIGTGWKPIATLLFYLMGAKTIYTYDHVRHVRFKLLHVVLKEIENEIEYI